MVLKTKRGITAPVSAYAGNVRLDNVNGGFPTYTQGLDLYTQLNVCPQCPGLA